MATSGLSHKTLKHITALSFRIAPTSTSQATTTLRLMLSSMPFKPPKGFTSVPQTALATVQTDAEQSLEVTYSDKKTQKFNVEGVKLSDLIRKVEAPAKLLRNKEEGL